MELGLSLGEAPKAFAFMDRSATGSKGLGFCIGLGVGLGRREEDAERRCGEERDCGDDGEKEGRGSVERPVQLELLPLAPVPRQPPPQMGLAWQGDHGNSEASTTRGFDVNQLPLGEEIDDGAAISSPNSTVSSFQMDFSIYKRGIAAKRKDSDPTAANETEMDRASSRASDEEENGLARKKLRLSKEQSAFLEESFKEHNTLNPKQKLALAKQLNLRPRQVEVWFQNRRARTKLKQTEVDCEYLKRCCETLTEENRRLQKELQELRALKTAHPFYMQLPATTLTMCPSCERVATTTTATGAADSATKAAGFAPIGLPKNRFYTVPQPHQSAA
ncbi:homeobox-leucine zipper protein HOX11-like [Aristolochia californica]|uniref:homeobox-leucine zipper protein HOX11-like n=1 Tax=Aristolochia californica TaxID=171875 RepID=UPI0035DCEAFE